METNVLFICGSLRERSLNRQAGHYVASLLPEGAHASWLDYADLPFMNQDIEFPVPDSVERVRKAVSDADALWLFAPEYNHGIPGVLKNCLDWLSRPIAPNSKETALKGKPVTYTCAGGGSKASYCDANLAETLSFAQANLIDTAIVRIALDRHDYTTDTLELAPTEQAALATQASLLLAKLEQISAR